MSSLDNSYFKEFLEDLNSLNEDFYLSDIGETKEDFKIENTNVTIKSLNFSNLDIKNIRYLNLPDLLNLNK